MKSDLEVLNKAPFTVPSALQMYCEVQSEDKLDADRIEWPRNVVWPGDDYFDAWYYVEAFPF